MSQDKVQLMPASELAKITLTEEEANVKQVKDFATGMFQDIHKRATEFGRREFEAPTSVDPKAKPLAEAVVKIFQELGYTASLDEQTQTIPTTVEDGADGVKTEDQEVVVSRVIKVSY